MAEEISVTTALTMALDIVLACRIHGMKEQEPEQRERIEKALGADMLWLSLTWERAWGTAASLHVALRTKDEKKFPDYDLEIEVGWSTTKRTPSQAIAAVALYEEVSRAACEIEARLGSCRIVRVLKDSPK